MNKHLLRSTAVVALRICASAFFIADLLSQGIPKNTFQPNAVETTDSCNLPPLGLIGWWSGDETANDLTGRHHGTLSGGVSYARGFVDRAFRFSGTNGFVNVPSSEELDLHGSLTISAWVKPDNFTTPGGPEMTGYPVIAGRPWNYQMTIIPDGRIRFGFPSNAPLPLVNQFVDSTVILTKTDFTYVVATYDASTGQMRIYINGSLNAERIISGLIDSATRAFQIGGFSDPNLPIGHGAYSGLIDEVQLFNRALSTTEIKNIFSSGRNGVCKETSSGRVTLLPTTSPSYGQPGTIVVSLTGSGFPTGAIQPKDISLTLEPLKIGDGPTERFQAQTVTTIVGSTKRISFVVPATFVLPSPKDYLVFIQGNTTSGQRFASSNKAKLTINPPAKLLSISPASASPGTSLKVALVGQYTNFVNGSTALNLGPDIIVSSLAVSSSTAVSAQISISASAPIGARNLIVTTGTQQASLINGFSLAISNKAPIATAGEDQTIRLPIRTLPTSFSAKPLPGLAVARSAAFDINDLSEVAGMAQDSQGRLRPVIWRNGIVDALPTLDGPQGATMAIGIAGTAVGQSQTVNGDWRLFSYTDSAVKDLGPALHGCCFWNMGINRSDQIVGLAPPAQAVIHVDGVTKPLQNLPGSSDSVAIEINDKGLIVGRSSVFPLVWENETVHQLPGFSDKATGAAYSVNNRGEIVGVIGDLGQDTSYRAVLWKDRQPVDLGVQGIAYSINDFNQILIAGRKSFLWQDGKTVLLDPFVAPYCGAEPSVLRRLNNKTQIVGYCGTNEPAPGKAAFILEPNEFTSSTVDILLKGTVRDDGLPLNSSLSIVWQKVSGPGPVSFSAVNQPETIATFSEPGTYVLRLVASDPLLSGSDEVTVTVETSDHSPIVDAGPNQNLSTDITSLKAIVLDNGCGKKCVLTAQWRTLSGPGQVTFSDPASLSTTAKFTTPGTYRLRVIVDNNVFSGADDVEVVVVPSNQPPSVTAGPDQTIVFPASALLNGSVTDDGKPLGTLALSWTKQSGLGTVSFSAPTAISTTVHFEKPGDYVLRLTATDSALSSFDDVTIHVLPSDRPIAVDDTFTMDGEPLGQELLDPQYKIEKFLSIPHPLVLAVPPNGSPFGNFLYVASVKWGVGADNIYRINLSNRSLEKFYQLPEESDPIAMEFGPGAPYTGNLYISSNNRDTVAGISDGHDDGGSIVFLEPDPTINGEQFLTRRPPPGGLSEPVAIAFGRMNELGMSLFVNNVSDSPSGIQRVAPNGETSLFAAMYNPSNTYGMAFAQGNGFGNNLYSAFGYNQIVEVLPNGQSTLFHAISGTDALGSLAFSTNEHFKKHLYATAKRPQQVFIDRIRADRSVSEFAKGFIGGPEHDPEPDVLQFSNDGDSLFIADDGAGAVYRIFPKAAPSGNVLTNDGNNSGVSLTTVLVTNPENGLVTLNADGTFFYTPKPGFTGTDSFAYKVNADGQDSLPAKVTLIVGQPVVLNQPSIVDAGKDTSVVLPNSLSLNGVVSDDGMPGTSLTLNWTKRSGLGTVSFSSSSSATTTATFSVPGKYVLRLSASDGAITSTADVMVIATGTEIPSPSISLISPNSARQGQTGPITIIGKETHFGAETTVAFGTGIAVTNIVVTDATHLSATISISDATLAGPRDVIVVTGSESVTASGGFTVTPALPFITSINPASVRQGGSLNVAIAGRFTHFQAGTTIANFGDGIVITEITVASPILLTAQMAVSPDATIGPRTITLTTGSEIVTLAGVFTVQPGLPVITSIAPSSGQQGQNITVGITGQFTHFGPSTVVNIGTGVTVNSITVTDATHLTAQLSISSSASTGSRTVTVTTGSEVTTLTNGFAVIGGSPTLLSILPVAGRRAQIIPVAITGQNTHFATGTTINAGSGVSVTGINIVSSTVVEANFDISLTAALGSRNIVVTSGSEVLILPSAFQVDNGTPVITEISPSTAQPGESKFIMVKGEFTAFENGITTVSLGPDIAVQSITVIDASSLTATIVVSETARSGPRAVVITTRTERLEAQDKFFIEKPALISLTPAAIQQGVVVDVTIKAKDTHFLAGSSLARFGEGIAVGEGITGDFGLLTVIDSVTAIARLSVSPAARVGSRLVTVRTGTEVVELEIWQQLLPDFNNSHSSADVVHLGDNLGDSRFLPRDPSGTVYTVRPHINTVLAKDFIPVLLVDQYQADNNNVETRSFVSSHERRLGFLSFNNFITDLTGHTTIPVVTDIFSLSGVDLTSPTSEVSVRAGRATTTGSDQYDDLSLTNLRISGSFTVTGVNAPPNVDAGPDRSTTLLTDLTLQGTFSDDGLPLGSMPTVHWEKVSGLGLVTFDNPSSATTIARFNQIGIYVLRLSVSDSLMVSSDELTVVVAGGGNLPPAITIAPSWSVTLPSRLIVTYIVTDDGKPSGGKLDIAWDKISGPCELGFSDQSKEINPGSISVGFACAGTFTLRITATDTLETVTKDIVVTVTGTLPTAPTLSITTPTEAQEVTSPTEIRGTVVGTDLLSWTLERRRAEEPTFIEFARGSGPVSNATLGTFDSTLLLNGVVEIRLTAKENSGRVTSSAPVSVVVRGNQKIGIFTVSFNDLTIPMPGMPISVVRTYDSRDKIIGDFGVGWRLDLQTVRLTENGETGKRWTGTVTGSFIKNYCLVEMKPHIVSVTLPDNTVYQFRPVLSPQCQAVEPPMQVSLSFTPTGTTPPNVALTPVGNNLAQRSGTFPGPMELLDLDTTLPFDADRYRLTLPDGRVMELNQNFGLEKMTDLNGNTLTITASGITHSSGKSIAFVRDSLNRIKQITDPAGSTLKYDYDPSGDLRSSTDRENQTTMYDYVNPHYLTAIQDPRGIQPIRNEYDPDGRLKRHIDTFGKEIVYTHKIGTHEEVVKDRLGNVTVNEYDDQGNIVKVTDAEGGVTIREYDESGNIKKEINPLDKVREYTYDTNSNRKTEKDPLHKVTNYEYNAFNQVTKIIDPLNRVTENVYDALGNLKSTKDAENNVTEYVYNARGLMETMKNALSGITKYEYDSAGKLIKQTDPLNHVTTYTYDDNGNKRTETRTRTTSAGNETLATQFDYDKQDRLIKTTFPDLSITRIEYNSIGKQSAIFDQLNRKTDYVYDDLGRMVRTNFPDGTNEQSKYDDEGRRIESTDRGERTTTYEYDKVGRLIRTTFPDQAVVETQYDLAGQALTSFDARKNKTQYKYDDAGRRSEVIDALRQSTKFRYDDVGNQVEMTDANNNSTQYEYDKLNRRIKTIYADFSFDSVSYDALSRTKSKTDQAGKTTQFNYDAVGRLVEVIDALNQSTRYTYDEVGNRLTQTDANSHTTRFDYNKLGRRSKRTLPLGMSEAMSYDVAGNLKEKIDFSGRKTTYDYDAANRLVKKTPDPFFGAAPITFFYFPNGERSQMVDPSGTTAYTYDSRSRLLTKATPAGTLTYTYDIDGNLGSIRSSNAGGTSVDYAYDELNRLKAATDNRLSSGKTTTYLYDSAGNLKSYTYPNGVKHEYVYNTLNRLTTLTLTNASTTLASYAYTLGASGNRTKVVENGGRAVEYTYDNLYRLKSEKISGGTFNGTISYDYDPVGNRKSRTSTVAAVPASTYLYDANDRLTSDTYDANGNTIAASGANYSYDFENRLLTKNGAEVVLLYDGDGNRVSRTAGSNATKYLVDDRNLTGYAQVLEEIVDGEVQRVYTHGLNRISQSRASGTSFYGYDGHGSVRLLSGANGVIAERYDYDAFGIPIQTIGGTPNDYQYSGEQLDPGLTAYYLRDRYYNPFLGRFLTQDDFAGSIRSPLSLNKYVYVSASPTTMVDPSGRFGVEIVAISVANVLLSSYSINISRSTVLNPDVWEQRAQIIGDQAADAAKPLIANALAQVISDISRFEEYFGHRSNAAELQALKDYARTTFAMVQNALQAPIAYRFGVTQAGATAQAAPGPPQEILLGLPFFLLPDYGPESKAGIVIHELTHEVARAIDVSSSKCSGILGNVCYGFTNAITLAKETGSASVPLDVSKLAIGNADNYKYFATVP